MAHRDLRQTVKEFADSSCAALGSTDTTVNEELHTVLL